MDKPLLIIAGSKQQASAYAYTNGIKEYIFIKNANSLKGIGRGHQYVFVAEHHYIMSANDFSSLKEMLRIREHKAV